MPLYTLEYFKKLGEKVSNKRFTKMLMLQEARFWKSQKKQVEKEDFDFICERRGFSEKNRNTLKEVLKRLGIGDNL